MATPRRYKTTVRTGPHKHKAGQFMPKAGTARRKKRTTKRRKTRR